MNGPLRESTPRRKTAATPRAEKGAPSIDAINWSNSDFVDLGCSGDGSISHSVRRFGAKRGVGVAPDPRKVTRIRQTGVEAVVGDTGELKLDKRVRFAAMISYFSRLPNLGSVEKVIRTAPFASVRSRESQIRSHTHS